MKVSQILDNIEQRLQNTVTRRSPVDRIRLLDLLNQELNTTLTMMFFAPLSKRLHPIMLTEEGKSNYLLPDDFPENFIKGTNTVRDEGRFLCKLDSGTAESEMRYFSPARFFSKHREDEDNGRPTDYTVFANQDGGKEIWIAPPPDTNSESNYTLAGVYQPTVWNLREEDVLSPIGALAVLPYSVLRLVDGANPLWGQEYERHLNWAALRAAEGQMHRFQPLTWGRNLDY